MDVSFALTIAAFVLFVAAAFNFGGGRLGWAGLACLALALVLNGATIGG